WPLHHVRIVPWPPVPWPFCRTVVPAIRQTAPVLSMICVAGGSRVPSGEVPGGGGALLHGSAVPTGDQPLPIQRHHRLSTPNTWIWPLHHVRIVPRPPVCWPLRKTNWPTSVQTAPPLSTICVAGGSLVPSGDVPEGGALPHGSVVPTGDQPPPVQRHHRLSRPNTWIWLPHHVI